MSAQIQTLVVGKQELVVVEILDAQLDIIVQP